MYPRFEIFAFSIESILKLYGLHSFKYLKVHERPYIILPSYENYMEHMRRMTMCSFVCFVLFCFGQVVFFLVLVFFWGGGCKNSLILQIRSLFYM